MKPFFAVLLLLTSPAWAQSSIPVDVAFSFGGVVLRHEGPTMGSRFNVMVEYVKTAQGESLVQFTQERNGRRSSLPSISEISYAEVEQVADGKLKFKFEKPVVYRFVRTDERTGQQVEVHGQVQSIVADISEANRKGFADLLLGAPYAGYTAKNQMAEITEMARIYRTERPAAINKFPHDDLVPGLVLHGRPGLARFLAKQKFELPQILYPTSVPLKIVINPLTNKIVVQDTRVNGSPTLSNIGAIHNDIVGLTGEGTTAFGGPDGFATVEERYRQIDLQDEEIRDFLGARAEVLRMSRQLTAEYNHRNGIPTLVVSEDKIMLIKGGSSHDDYGFSGIETCVSLLSGRKTNAP